LFLVNHNVDVIMMQSDRLLAIGQGGQAPVQTGSRTGSPCKEDVEVFTKYSTTMKLTFSEEILENTVFKKKMSWSQ
jgi:hypothetical protein